MHLKKLRKDLHFRIEKGCFDAMAKKYLKTIIFGISCSSKVPLEMAETFTIGIDYGAHSQNPNNFPIRMATFNYENDCTIVKHDEMSSEKHVSRILKSICTIVQQLDGLPGIFHV